MGNLGSRVARELRQNPKKGVILAIMCVVALYYWVPIIRRWTSEKPGSAAHADSSSLEPPQLHSVAHQAVRWEAIAAQIDDDPRMKPANVSLDWNPFAESVKEFERERLAGTAESAPNEPTPAEVGLTLESTIVGLRRQTAVLNGQAFAVGDVVVAPELPGISYRLVRITVESVELERNGRRFTLRLADDQPDAAASSGWPSATPADGNHDQGGHDQRAAR